MSPHPMLPLLYKMIGHLAIVITGAGGLIAVDIDFRNQITLGSIIIAVLILTVAGLITIRSKIATIWREEAEGERAAKERLQEELNEAITARAEFERDQQEIRHDLKDKIAELNAQVKVMEAKTDLTVALDALKEIAAQQHHGHDETHRLLMEIRDKLPETPIEIKEPLVIREAGEK